jgi:hypothetical protein
MTDHFGGAISVAMLPKPQTPRDEADRALFFATALGVHCSRTLKEYVEHCEQGVSGGYKSDLNSAEFNNSVKELLSISIWLTLFEHDDGANVEWFKEFIIKSLNFADRLHPEPTSRSVMQSYDFGEGVMDTCQLASMNICHRLRLGATAPDAALHLGMLLMNAAPTRDELLRFSLTKTLDELDKRIHEAL